MTKKELSQLYYLNREIEYLQGRLEELETAATTSTQRITGMPFGTGISDKVGMYATEIADIKELLDLNLRKCFYEFNRLNHYINTIDDNEVRMILSLRYINGLSWEQIAASISCYASSDSVRMRHNRFLKEN